MSNKLYKIKPLSWEAHGWYVSWLVARSPFGEFYIEEDHRNGIFRVGLSDGDDVDWQRQRFKTLEEAKAFADDYNAELMWEGLEEVT